MKALILNPFEKYSENHLISFGIVITVIGSGIASLFNARFDGVFDLHFSESTSFLTVFSDNLMNIISLVFFLFIIGKSLNIKTRMVDILSISLIARTPYYVLPLFNFNDGIQKTGNQIASNQNNGDLNQILNMDLTLTILFAITCILLLVWYISLLFKGFKIATNAKGNKVTFLFILAIIGAEIGSKYLINILN